MTSSGEYTVSETARAAGISRQAYYKWLNRRLSLREQQEREVLEEIKRIEKRHQDSVGYDKMVRLLNKEGRLSYRVGIKRVSRIMKINGIRADYRQPKKDRQGAKQTYQDENLLNRQFKQEKPNQVWVTDTTELTYGTANKVRLHAILDLYGQRPAAWLISPTETREAAIKVFNQAAKASGTTPEMIHTDRGAAYTSPNYNEALRQERVRHSLSALGAPADNAVMEHWWADFKSIWLEHRPKAQTLAELQEQVRAGIMYFTNQFISAKRNDQTVAEYYHDLVG